MGFTVNIYKAIKQIGSSVFNLPEADKYLPASQPAEGW